MLICAMKPHDWCGGRKDLLVSRRVGCLEAVRSAVANALQDLRQCEQRCLGLSSSQFANGLQLARGSLGVKPLMRACQERLQRGLERNQCIYSGVRQDFANRTLVC